MLPILLFAASSLAADAQLPCHGALISSSDIKSLYKYSQNVSGETDVLHGVVKISEGVDLPYSFSITSKGNGAIEFPGIDIRIYDAHNDDITFKPFLLCIQLKDVNGDGYADIVLSGVAEHWDDRIDNKLLSSNPIGAVFIYDPKKNTFVAKSVSDEIDYWTDSLYCEGMKCKNE